VRVCFAIVEVLALVGEWAEVAVDGLEAHCMCCCVVWHGMNTLFRI
jgi:hypothetical protein